MFNMNGPPKGSNVTAEQSSYDLIYRDLIVSSSFGSNGGYNYPITYNLGTDSINGIYKAELISATIKFNGSIPNSVQNGTVILSIPELNGNTAKIACNTTNINSTYNQVWNPTTNTYDNVPANGSNSSQGSNIVQGNIFCQIPDNNTPLTVGGGTSNNIISLYIGPHMYDSVQFYNPPISRLNKIDVSFFATNSNQLNIDPSAAGTINSFYFTLRIHYLQKRMATTAFSTSVFTNGASGTIDSIFQR